MAKISRRAQSAHQYAKELALKSDFLSPDQRDLVLSDFHEGAEHTNGLAGAFFTPEGLARDFAIEVPEGARILDLCAGIGRLSHHIAWKAKSITCLELNPHYVEIGRKIVPQATWICGDALDVALYEHLGPFDFCISNPPFGKIQSSRQQGFSSGNFEMKVIEAASRVCPMGAFIVPQGSAPFQYSGRQDFCGDVPAPVQSFMDKTGIELQANCGIDTSVYKDQWNGVSPICEIVLMDSPPAQKSFLAA